MPGFRRELGGKHPKGTVETGRRTNGGPAALGGGFAVSAALFQGGFPNTPDRENNKQTENPKPILRRNWIKKKREDLRGEGLDPRPHLGGLEAERAVILKLNPILPAFGGGNPSPSMGSPRGVIPEGNSGGAMGF